MACAYTPYIIQDAVFALRKDIIMCSCFEYYRIDDCKILYMFLDSYLILVDELADICHIHLQSILCAACILVLQTCNNTSVAAFSISD